MKLKKCIDKSTVVANIFSEYLVMCAHFCSGFIDFRLKGKTSTGFTNVFLSNSFKKKKKKKKKRNKKIII